MKIVATGGLGFVGGTLVKKLGMDREVIVSVCDLPDCDLRNYDCALEFIRGADVVYHFAAAVGSEKYTHGSKEAELNVMQTNLVIDANVFKACREANVKKIIYASSCAVYSMERQKSLGAVFCEDDAKFIDPDGGYGWAKSMGEIQLQWMENVGIIRPFNIYGIGEVNGHVVSDLIRKAVKYPEKQFEIFGGQQTRDFIYVDDVVDAMIALEKKVGGSPIILNIGSGQATSIKELAEKIIKISGKDINPIYVETPIRQYSRTANISKAKEILEWSPKVNLDEGLRKTYEWLQDNRLDLHKK